VEKIVYRSNSPVKDEVCEIREKLDVTQCKTVMAYKSDYEDIYTAKLFTGLLGCTPFSKLFVNVREKLSLCYYCSAGYIDLKGTMVIQSGVEKANIERAREAVEEQVEQLKQGNFTDEELYNTKLYLCGLYKSNYDTTGDTASWYEAQITRGTELTPEQQSEILMNVTREQVIECAKSFRLDTVYVMESDSEVRDSE
jgi:predicted Zn-dependent peptidase